MFTESASRTSYSQLYKSSKKPHFGGPVCQILILFQELCRYYVGTIQGNTKVAQLLIENDAKVNIKDKFGMTPLMVAAAKGFLDIVQELERKGAKFKVS